VTALQAHLVVTRGQFHLDLELSAEAGEIVALLGPNGAGKTTALSALAGLVPLEAGRVVLGERVLEDPEAGVRLPPEQRRIGVVFSDALLFPHLTALENVAFGPRAGGVPRAEARRRARRLLDSLDAGDLAARRPGQLSRGQAQRVAIARALAVEPDLLVLDEPLSALDAAARPRVRVDLRSRLVDSPSRPCLLVTHDFADAVALADRVVVIEAGQSTQTGSPRALADRPKTEYVTRLTTSSN
jgi:molybdate transport system ATP-binding protein